MTGYIPWIMVLVSLLPGMPTASGQHVVQEVETLYCNHSNRHTLVATDHIQAKILTLSSLPGPTGANQPFRNQCDIWVIKSQDRTREITVMINSLDLFGDDLVFVLSESPEGNIRLVASNTTDPDLGLHTREFTSSSPLTLLWAHRSRSTNGEAPVQKLAFSYMLVTEIDPENEEKERFVLVGAILVSAVTIIATIISIARCAKCSCFRYLWELVSIRKTATVGYGRDGCISNNSGNRTSTTTTTTNNNNNNIRLATSRDETILLMEFEVRGQSREGESSSLISTNTDVDETDRLDNETLAAPVDNDDEDNANDECVDENGDIIEQRRDQLARGSRRVAFDERRNTILVENGVGDLELDPGPALPVTDTRSQCDRTNDCSDAASPPPPPPSSSLSVLSSSSTLRPTLSRRKEGWRTDRRHTTSTRQPHPLASSSAISSSSPLSTTTAISPASSLASSSLRSSVPTSGSTDLPQATSTSALAFLPAERSPRHPGPSDVMVRGSHDPPPPYSESPPPAYSCLFPDSQ